MGDFLGAIDLVLNGAVGALRSFAELVRALEVHCQPMLDRTEILVVRSRSTSRHPNPPSP